MTNETKMTSEQWNGLVALMRAVAVAAAEHDKGARLEAKRQAGACESNVRKMFVDVTDMTGIEATKMYASHVRFDSPATLHRALKKIVGLASSDHLSHSEQIVEIEKAAKLALNGADDHTAIERSLRRALESIDMRLKSLMLQNLVSQEIAASLCRTVHTALLGLPSPTTPFPKWVEYVGSWQAGPYLARIRSDGAGWDAIVKVPSFPYELAIDTQIVNAEATKRLCETSHEHLVACFSALG
jgi:hypothetical protein